MEQASVSPWKFTFTFELASKKHIVKTKQKYLNRTRSCDTDNDALKEIPCGPEFEFWFWFLTVIHHT